MNTKDAKVGMRVRVMAAKPNGEDHPHAGKTGTITHIHYVLGPLPTAHVLIDEGFEQAGTLAVVSLICLEAIE